MDLLIAKKKNTVNLFKDYWFIGHVLFDVEENNQYYWMPFSAVKSLEEAKIIASKIVIERAKKDDYKKKIYISNEPLTHNKIESLNNIKLENFEYTN